MASLPAAWLSQRYALVHGEDADARRAAVAAWRTRHVDSEWEDFSLTVCSEGCPWAEVQNALCEAAPMGVDRIVVVPQAENLLDKPKDLPPSIAALLAKPLEGTALLLVSRVTLSAAPGKALGAKPFKDWAKEGRVLKTGALEAGEVAGFLEETARNMGMGLERDAAALLQERLGCHAGTLTRALEVLDLAREGNRVGRDLVEALVFQMDEPKAFAWSEAWQKGSVDQALKAMRQVLEEDPAGAAVGMVGQASRDVGRVLVLAQALEAGISAEAELARIIQLPGNQTFLLGRSYLPVARKLGVAGARRLHAMVAAVDRDVKGVALSSCPTALTTLTFELWRAWRR